MVDPAGGRGALLLHLSCEASDLFCLGDFLEGVEVGHAVTLPQEGEALAQEGEAVGGGRGCSSGGRAQEGEAVGGGTFLPPIYFLAVVRGDKYVCDGTGNPDI